MYKPFSLVEKDHATLCLQAGSYTDASIESYFAVLDTSAKYQDRPAFEVFQEIEEEKKFMKEFAQPINPSVEVMRFVIDSIPSQSTRIYNAYDVLYGKAKVSSLMMRMKMQFWNSQKFRDSWMDQRGLPTGLSAQEAEPHIRAFATKA